MPQPDGRYQERTRASSEQSRPGHLRDRPCDVGRVANPSTPPKRTPSFSGCPILRAFVLCEGSGFRRSVATTGPSSSYLACGSGAAEALRRHCQNREPSPLILHLHYRNYCAIISRALISSSQGGYMVNAARASATRATTPPSPRRAKISHHQHISVLPAIVNRHKMQLESSVTFRKQTTAPNSNQHKFCPKPAPALRAPAVTTHQPPTTPFLFDTNKTHRIIIPPRALLKTKDKQFSIQYKFASRRAARMTAKGGGNGSCNGWRSEDRRYKFNGDGAQLGVAVPRCVFGGEMV